MAQQRGEDGFSLVELLVILLILSVLAGLAIGAYLSQRQTAHQTAAISTLKNLQVYAESRRVATGGDAFAADPAAYEDAPYTFVPATSAPSDASTVSMWVADDGTVAAFGTRGGERCFYLRLDGPSATVLQHSAAADVADCAADEFTSGAGAGWR